MTKTSIIIGKIEEWAAAYSGPLFHSFLCDPPYHLTSIVERYGSDDAAPPTGRVYSRSSKGFMGKQWDGGDVAFRPATWAAILKTLHHGAFGMAFASTRGFHRMAVAMEDAGFIIHPAIMAWGFGSGFPKGTRIDNQIDKAAGAERKRVAIPADQVRNQKSVNGGHGVEGGDRPYMRLAQEQGYYMADAGEAVTEQAKQWIDYRYGGQALKPALEPIVVVQAPYPKRTGKGAIKPFQSMVATGAGALNIGGGAVRGDDPNMPPRYPAGLALVHHPHCEPDHCIEGCPVEEMSKSGDQSKGRRGKKVVTKRSTKRSDAQDFDLGASGGEYAGDSGSADRYFERVNWQMETDEAEYWQSVEDKIDAAPAIHYEAKPSTRERKAGIKGNAARRSDARPDSPDMTGKFPDHDGRESNNPHPTVKPMALTRWLATLLLPPDAYAPNRRILVPFAGVSSEMIGAAAAGWDEIVGVELTPEYAEVGQQRLDYWLPRFEAERRAPKPQPLPIEIAAPAQPAPRQLSFFETIDRFLLSRESE